MKPGKSLRIPSKNQASIQFKARERDHRLVERPPHLETLLMRGQMFSLGTSSQTWTRHLSGSPRPGPDARTHNIPEVLGTSSVTFQEELKQPVRSFSKLGGEVFRNVLLPVLLSVRVPSPD